MPPCLIAPPESEALGRAIAQAANWEWADVEERRFAGGEFTLRPLVAVGNRDVCVVQTLAPTVGTETCDPVQTRYVAELLEAAGMTHLIALDVHDLAALDNSFRVPVDHRTARPLFVDWLVEQPLSDPLAVASPDIGGIKRAQLFREHLEKRLGRAVEFLFMEKRRAAGHISGQQIVGQAGGRHVLLIDDLCATGETLLRAAASFHDAGALRVSAAITHVASAEGLRALCANRYLSHVVVTDSALTPEVEMQDSAHGKLYVRPCASLFSPCLAQLVSR